MIKIVKELKIEVSKPNVFQAIVAKQYDMNTRFLKVRLVDDGSEISVSQSATKTVVINADRPDGQSKGFDGIVNEDGTVTVPLHSWMLELDGTVICDISIIDTAVENNKKLTTTSFTLIVEKAAYGGDDVTTDPQYDVLIELIERVEDLEKGVADQTYDPYSANAQSGIAVAEAIASIPQGGGGSGIVDQTYNPDSKNAQSGVALKPILQNKIEFWKPNTEYKVGDTIIGIIKQSISFGGRTYEVQCIDRMICKENHISSGSLTPYESSQYWDDVSLSVLMARASYLDSKGNPIVETYATKEEVGNIETALDSIIAIQENLIGGGSV